MKNRPLAFALLLGSAVALVLHTLVWNFVTDDAYISFVYAKNLAEHGQLVFNLGERVEGYTNFLWTVTLAAFLKVGLVPEIMSRVLGTAFGIATMFVVARLLRALRVDGWWIALPALFLCSSPGYACWSSGGLETMQFTFLFTCAATRYLVLLLDDAPPDAWVGVLFGLSALARPEGVLFFALTGVHRLGVLIKKRALPSRSDFAAAGAFLALVVPHFLWRKHYYGWWLPNTFYIKASGIGGTWEYGRYYLMRMSEALHTPLAILVVLVVLVIVRSDIALRRAAIYGLFVTGVFYLYIASVGGDFMGLFRFAMPVVPLLFALMSAALFSGSRTMPRGALALTLVLLVAHVAHAFPLTKHYASIPPNNDHGIDTPGYLRWYTEDRAAIGKWFGTVAQPDDFAAVGGAGAQVYFSGIKSLDCFGLSDAHIAHDVPAASSRPGHQKYAPEPYVLSRKPTIITSGDYRCCGPQYVSDHFHPPASLELGWERKGYHYVHVKVPGLSSPWYSFLLRNDRQMPGVESERK